jgi:hypothetical protein
MNAKSMSRALATIHECIQSTDMTDVEKLAVACRQIALVIGTSAYISQFGGDDAYALKAIADRIEQGA